MFIYLFIHRSLLILSSIVRWRVGRKDYEELDLAFCLGLLSMHLYFSFADVPPCNARHPQTASTAAGGGGVLLRETLLHFRLPFQTQNMDLLWWCNCPRGEWSASVSVFHSVGACLSAHLSACLPALSSFLSLPAWLFVSSSIHSLACLCDIHEWSKWESRNLFGSNQCTVSAPSKWVCLVTCLGGSLNGY